MLGCAEMMMQESVGIRDRQLSGQYSKDQLQQRPSMNTNGEREQDQALKCPRCDSPNTKFCYYNNYNLTQPRHFCKTCRRYWTKGGALRNVPIGGGCRKNKKSKQRPKDQNPLSPVDHDTSLNVSNGLSLLHNLWPTPAAASLASTFLDLPSPDRFVNLTFAKLQNHSSLLLGTHPNNADPNTISSSSVSIMSMLQQQQQEASMKGDNIEDPSGSHMINPFRNPGAHMMAPPSSSTTIEPGTCSLNFGVESLRMNNTTCVDTRDWAWRLQQQQRLGMGMVVGDQPQNTGMDSVIPVPDHLILGDQRYSHVQHHYMKGKTAALSNDLVHNQPYDIRPISEWQSLADSLLEVAPTPVPPLGESSHYWHDLQPM